MEANRKMSFRVKVLGISVATALLAACGGGGGAGTSNTSSTSIPGQAVDFYLKGATVTFTDCGGATATTDAQGNFTTPLNCSASAYTVTGGTDIGTGLAFNGILKSSFSSSNSKTIASPLTTLLAYNPSLSLASLGVTANPYTTDPMTDAASLRAAEVVQALLNQVSLALQSAGASPQAAADAAAKALANTVTGSTFSLTDTTNVQAVITAAVANSGVTLPSGTTAASLAVGVANQVASVNAALANIAIGSTPAVTLAALQAGGVTSALAAVATNTALTNYIQLGNVTLNGTSKTLAEIQASTATPITVPGGLSDIQINMTGVGTYATSTQTVDTSLTYTTNGNTVNVVIKGIKLTFSGSTLTAATVPAGASYSFNVTGNSSASATLTNSTADNLLSSSGGNVDLSIPTFLNKLHGAASSVNTSAYMPAPGVTTTASFTMTGSAAASNTAVSVGDVSGKPVAGVNASVN